MAVKFYPDLTSIIQTSGLPEELSFISGGINTILDNLYFRNFRVLQTASGDTTSFSLDLVSLKELGFEIPGAGITFVLNPGHTDISYIPVNLVTSIPIKKYIRNFSPNNFSFLPEAFFEIIAQIINIPDSQLLILTATTFIEAPDQLNQFAVFVNTEYGLSIPTPVSSDTPTAVNSILTEISASSVTLQEIVLSDYLIDKNLSNSLNNVNRLFFAYWGVEPVSYFKKLIVPNLSAGLTISAGIRFPRNILMPMRQVENDFVVETNTSIKSTLIFGEAEFYFSTNHGIGYNSEITASFQAPYIRAQIGNTPLQLELNNVKLDLSRKTNIPEADAAGYPTDFIGVYIQQAVIGLPAFWQKDANARAEIYGRNLLIGTGGLSGTIGMEALDSDDPNPALLETKFGGNSGFALALEAFDLTFQQNVIIGSNIHGTLTIPGFKRGDNASEPAVIDVTVAIKDGDFHITAAPQPALTITLPDLLDIHIKSCSVGKEGNRRYLELTGDLKFKDQGGAIGEFMPDSIDIERFRIWSDGKVEFAAGGSNKLKKPKSLKIGPVKLTVTAIHYGVHEQVHEGQMRKYWYFGFDGGVSINPGGIDARGDGIKFYFTVDNDRAQNKKLHVFLRIQSISLDLVLPGSAKPDQAVLLLSGYLSMKDPAPGNNTQGAGTEYIGGVSFSLPKIGLGGSAAMRLNPDIPAFLVDIGLELPGPIPLGPTGLGIYGFRGLVGNHYVASRTEAGLAPDASWYEYYKAKVAPDHKQGVQVSKFAPEKGFSIGAGASIATAADSGKAFSSKVFLLLSIPELFAIQGQAALLKKRLGLDSTEDPPFSLFLAISKESVTAGFGVNIKLPESGLILDAHGLVEMGFFFKDASAWCINVGSNPPENKRIQARVLSLFNMYSYLMLSGRGIQAGAGASFGFNKGIGPLRVILSAYIDLAGKLSFKPQQIGGSIALGGEAAVKILFIKLGVQVYATLAAEAAKPLIVSGSAGICVPKPGIFRRKKKKKKKICVSVDFTWRIDRTINMDENAILEPGKAKALNVMSGESFALLYQNSIPSTPPDLASRYTIPVDSFIEIEFLRGMGPGPTSSTVNNYYRPPYGANYVEFFPPQKGKSQQVQHTYLLLDIHIKIWNRQSRVWEDYAPYEAMTPALVNSTVNYTGTIGNLKYGSWQAFQPNTYNRLRLLCQSPLSYMQHSGGISTEKLGFRDNFLSCLEPRRKHCVNFENSALRVFEEGKNTYYKESILVKTINGEGRVHTAANSFGFSEGLVLAQDTEVEVLFTASAAKVDLKIGTAKAQVQVSYYKRVLDETAGSSTIPVFTFAEISSVTIDETNLSSPISYEDTTNGLSDSIDKMVIKGIGTCPEEGWLLKEEGTDLLKEDTGKLLLEDGNTCTTSLYEICWEEIADYRFNATLPPSQSAVDTENDLVKEAIEHTVQPVWRPDSVFAVQLVTRDRVQGNYLETYDRNHVFLFKTAGPIGHFHQFRQEYKLLETQDREQQYKLSSLKHYIDYAKSYPNADGKLTDAKPLFYLNPELNLFYKYNTVYTMYQDFTAYKGNPAVTSRLTAAILDPAPEDAQQYKDAEWEDASSVVPAIVKDDIKHLQNLYKTENPDNCSQTDLGQPKNIKSKFLPDSLQPDKLYTAVFQAAFNQEQVTEVLSYVFRTSRYADFPAQINSFYMKDEDEQVKDAVFFIEKAWAASDLSNVQALIENPQSFESLKDTYANSFDRVINGFLKLAAIVPAATTEVNILKDITPGSEKVIGILLRNPEPFNDPKIPEAVIKTVIKMKFSATQGGSITRTNTVNEIFPSKDGANMFITFNDNGIQIQPGYLYFDFTYLVWNGKNYIEASVISNLEVEVQ